MKDLFLLESTENLNLPIGRGLRTPVFHPEDSPSTPYTNETAIEWRGPPKCASTSLAD